MMFIYRGERCRETIKLPPTPKNIKYVARWRETILHEIATGQFDYARHFPDSTKARKHVPGAGRTVERALESWLEATRKTAAYSTWEDYRNSVRHHLIPEFGTLPLRELTTAAVKEWIGGLKAGPKRVNNLLIPLRGVCADAYADGLIDRDPMSRVRNLKLNRTEPDPFSPDEIRLILEHCDGQVRHFWQFAFASGLRTGELIGLTWDQVDWQRGTVFVSQSVVRGRPKDSTKTAAGVREVKLLPMAESALKAQKEHTYLAGGAVFHRPGYDRAWTTPEELARVAWRPVLRRAKVRYRNLYQTRHTYASTLLTAGEDPMWVAHQLGHSDWGMIRRVYGRWIPDMRPEAGQRAAEFLGHGWGKTGTTGDNLGRLGAKPGRGKSST